MPPRQELQITATEMLRALGVSDAVFRLTVESDFGTIQFKLDTKGDLGRPVPAPLGRWLSPLEERILTALSERDWTPADKLAEALGESPTGDFRAVVRNLVERGILESAPSRGYRLFRPE